MNVLLISILFPNAEKTGNLYTDLAKEFKANNHNITVIAPSDTNKSYLSTEDGITVLRVNTFNFFSNNFFVKVLSYLTSPLFFIIVFLRYLKQEKFELILWPTPSITFYPFVKYLKKKYNSYIYLILRDIFPHDAADVNIIKRNGFFFKLLCLLEKNTYNISDKIGCMSQANIQFVKSKYPKLFDSKLEILENFQNISSHVNYDEKILHKFNLEGKFIAVFGGNIGTSQKLENVLYLAKKCEILKDVIFLILGNGTQLKSIKKKVTEFNCSNVNILNSLPRNEYRRLVSSCNIGIISLNECLTTPNIPSKAMTYFECAIPVLASIDKTTDFGEIIVQNQIGLYSIGGDTETFFNNFCFFYNNKTIGRIMGYNGRKYLEKNMSTKVALDKILSSYYYDCINSPT